MEAHLSIESVGTRVGNSLTVGQYPSQSRSNERPTPSGAPSKADAIRVEVSPEARRRGAAASVAANNAEAASSAGWFASDEGRSALDDLLTGVAR